MLFKILGISIICLSEHIHGISTDNYLEEFDYNDWINDQTCRDLRSRLRSSLFHEHDYAKVWLEALKNKCEGLIDLAAERLEYKHTDSIEFIKYTDDTNLLPYVQNVFWLQIHKDVSEDNRIKLRNLYKDNAKSVLEGLKLIAKENQRWNSLNDEMLREMIIYALTTDKEQTEKTLAVSSEINPEFGEKFSKEKILATMKPGDTDKVFKFTFDRMPCKSEITLFPEQNCLKSVNYYNLDYSKIRIEPEFLIEALKHLNYGEIISQLFERIENIPRKSLNYYKIIKLYNDLLVEIVMKYPELFVQHFSMRSEFIPKLVPMLPEMSQSPDKYKLVLNMVANDYVNLKDERVQEWILKVLQQSENPVKILQSIRRLGNTPAFSKLPASQLEYILSPDNHIRSDEEKAEIFDILAHDGYPIDKFTTDILETYLLESHPLVGINHFDELCKRLSPKTISWMESFIKNPLGSHRGYFETRFRRSKCLQNALESFQKLSLDQRESKVYLIKAILMFGDKLKHILSFPFDMFQLPLDFPISSESAAKLLSEYKYQFSFEPITDEKLQNGIGYMGLRHHNSFKKAVLDGNFQEASVVAKSINQYPAYLPEVCQFHELTQPFLEEWVAKQCGSGDIEAYLNVRNAYSSFSLGDETCLSEAVANNQVEMVKKLFQTREITMNKRNVRFKYSLMSRLLREAYKNKRYEMVKVLRKYGQKRLGFTLFWERTKRIFGL